MPRFEKMNLPHPENPEPSVENQKEALRNSIDAHLAVLSEKIQNVDSEALDEEQKHLFEKLRTNWDNVKDFIKSNRDGIVATAATVASVNWLIFEGMQYLERAPYLLHSWEKAPQLSFSTGVIVFSANIVHLVLSWASIMVVGGALGYVVSGGRTK